MSSIKEAWDSGRPIYNRLPNRNGGYDRPPSDWLTSFWDESLVSLKEKVDDIPARQINPLRCDEEWLDFLAGIYGWDADHWQKDWAPEAKRSLLSRSLDFIWERKGNKDVLVYVLNSLNLKNRVTVRGDFLVGIGEVGDLIGQNPYEFDVILPTSYQNSNQFLMVQYVVERFAPCWLERHYKFDDAPFRVSELLEVSERAVLENGQSKAIDVTK